MMNSLSTKLVIAASTLFLSVLLVGLWHSQKPVPESLPAADRIMSQEPAKEDSKYEKIIYTCQIGDEDVSALQIAEVKDFNGNILGVAAHVYAPRETHLFIEGATPKWDYSAVSAQTGGESIKIIHLPQKPDKTGSWVLMLEGKEIYLQQKVKNCAEVSDE